MRQAPGIDSGQTIGRALGFSEDSADNFIRPGLMEVKLSVIGAAGKSEETDVSARNQCPAPSDNTLIIEKPTFSVSPFLI